MDKNTILENLGFEALNEMQEAAYESIRLEKDVLLLAPTGSGKTLAFLFPIATMLDPSIKGVQCLILTPSRELAIQIEQVWRKMGTGFKVNTVYGGHDIKTEVQNLSEAPSVLVGTPGRLLDHLERRSFTMEGIRTFVLDEFDKSLQLGFQEQMQLIMERLPVLLEKRILVSATSSVAIPEFTGIDNPAKVDFTDGKKLIDGLTLKRVISEDKDKIDRLAQLLCYIGNESTLIFCTFRDAAERTCQLLQEKGIDAAFFHGGMEQIDREKTLVKFRNGSTTYLIASDLAARGLDIPLVKHVIHYHIPLKREDFTHRNGRTARMNAEGTSYLLMSRGEELPHYLKDAPAILEFPSNIGAPKGSEWATIYVSGGKKDKLSKMDIVGFFCQKGGLEKSDIGLIENMDFMTFVAVKKDKVQALLKAVAPEKMKGKKYKIEVTK